jgi:hypothetical protein
MRRPLSLWVPTTYAAAQITPICMPQRMITKGPLADQIGGSGAFEAGSVETLHHTPGHLLQDLRQRTVLGEQLIDVATNAVGRRYSDRLGRRSFLR